MYDQDKQYKEKMKNTEEKFLNEAEDRAKKAARKKIIAFLGIKGTLVLVLVIILASLLSTVFLAAAIYFNDWDTKTKAVSAKEKAIGNEALGKIITLENDKYKISYEDENGDNKTGKEAIESALTDGDMNFKDFTDEEIECLYKCLKAEWATTYPNLGQSVDNAYIDGEYIQGVITIKRANYNNAEAKELIYKPYQEFSTIKDATALDYFSMKDGNIIVASWSTHETKYELNEIKGSLSEDIKNSYVSSEKQINIAETAINYRSMIGVHTVPFEFLLSILVNTEDIEFVNKLADSALNSTIEITIFDNTTEITTVEKEHIKEETTYKKILDYTIKTENKETLVSGLPGHGSVNYTKGTETISSSDKKELEYEVTKTTITENNSYVVGLTNVSSWLADVTNSYIYSPEYGKKVDLGSGTEYNYGPEVQEEDINPPSSDSEVEAFRKSKESTSSHVDEYNGATHETIITCTINKAKKQGTLNGTNKLEEYSSTTNKYKYEKGTSQTSNIGEKFKQAYDNSPKAQAQLDSVASWLFELLEETESSVDYVSVMKYLLYISTGKDYGVREIDLDLFKEESFSFVGTIQGDNAYHAFLLAWEGTRKDESGNFILHRPNDVTIGYGLFLWYNLDLFQGLGYFKTLNQEKWEKDLYEIRRQRVVNKEDLKFYNYELENGNLVRKEQIPNADIQKASENSRNNFRESVEKDSKFKLSSNQYDALAVIKYKWGNIGNFNEVYHYYQEGDKDKFLSSFLVSGVNPMKKERDFTERKYAAWIMFDEGRYLDRSGNEIAIASNSAQETRSFLDVAKERHDYIRTNNYTYVQGTSIPADASRNKGIDCSAFVSDVIYWYGYYNGFQKYVDTFKGHQHVSSWFMSKSNIESLGWKQLDISQVQAGDIIVKDGHVEIYAGDGKCYNAGSESAIRKEYTSPGIDYVKRI